MSVNTQPRILSVPPQHGCSLSFRLKHGADPRETVARIGKECSVSGAIIGFGLPLVRRLGAQIEGLRVFPALAGTVAVPSYQRALWVFLDGADRTTTVDASQRVMSLMEEAFVLDDYVDTFFYAGGRDLTGYEDGTENPKGDKAIEAAVVAKGPLAGSSFVAVQRWTHDLRHFRSHAPERCDHIIGRARESNEELGEAPATAHVKRSAQESFSPQAFMLRRSMPWAQGPAHGLEFIAFGKSFDAYEAVLKRMVGLEDGEPDALFEFSTPINGGYYWCPPAKGDRLDLTALRL
jgi:putative iron-dependent peroxidase